MLDGTAIGVLGGSFNPPHEGHRALVVHAMRRLKLARFRVLVSPQNPLKDPENYAPMEERLAATQELFSRLPTVSVEPEADEAPTYAINTIRGLIRKERHKQFVYLMGADTFVGLHRWVRWREIMQTIPIAVVSRPANRLAPLKAVAARAYWKHRIPAENAPALVRAKAPAWCFIDGLNRPESSTAIREARELEHAT
ncbi:MAG: nicotinate-nucleotide adenylyltransferase [Pseudomonadota bacterium]